MRPTTCFLWMMTLASFIAGTIIIIAGYYYSEVYDSTFEKTNCTYMSYNFEPFPYFWDTAYHASITTLTSDDRIWYTHKDEVYPPFNSVERETKWYAARWPIGSTEECYQSDIFQEIRFYLYDPYPSLWVSFGCFALSLFFIIATVVSCRKDHIRRNKHSDVSNMD